MWNRLWRSSPLPVLEDEFKAKTVSCKSLRELRVKVNCFCPNLKLDQLIKRIEQIYPHDTIQDFAMLHIASVLISITLWLSSKRAVTVKIARSPQTLGHARGLIEAEATVLEYLTTDVHVPKLLAYSIDPKNKEGSPFMIRENVVGEQAAWMWPRLTSEEHEKLLLSLIEYLSQTIVGKIDICSTRVKNVVSRGPDLHPDDSTFEQVPLGIQEKCRDVVRRNCRSFASKPTLATLEWLLPSVHLSNILVSSTDPTKVVAVIDWQDVKVWKLSAGLQTVFCDVSDSIIHVKHRDSKPRSRIKSAAGEGLKSDKPRHFARPAGRRRRHFKALQKFHWIKSDITTRI